MVGCCSFNADAVSSCAGAGSPGSASLAESEEFDVSVCVIGFSGVAYVRPNQPPSHADDVVGRSGVPAAGGVLSIGVSAPAPSVVPAAVVTVSIFASVALALSL